MEEEDEELERLIVEEARVSQARWNALEYLRRTPSLQRQKQLARVFVRAYSQALSFPAGRDFVTEVHDALTEDDIARVHHHTLATMDDPGCIPVPVPFVETEAFQSDNTGRVVSSLNQWDDCCSMLPTIIPLSTDERESHRPRGNTSRPEVHAVVESTCSVKNPCCALFEGSLSYLRLPILQEPVVSIKLPIGGEQQKMFVFEQDGYLRPFDPSVVLWPTGYLLTQCLANLPQCGRIEDLFHLAWSDYVLNHAKGSGPFAIELGAGLGVPSIVLSHLLNLRLEGDTTATTETVTTAGSRSLVVAADIAPHALATIRTNARINQVTGLHTVVLNHTHLDDARRVRAESFPQGGGGGYSLVLGSSLQSIFENPEDPESVLWKVLDVLLDRNRPNALAILAHGRSTLALAAPRDGSFELIRRISGDQFGMPTLWGASSDFEIFVFRRGTTRKRSTEGEL